MDRLSRSALVDAIFSRRTHYEACCSYIASNRDTLFSDQSILDLVFLGHHTTVSSLPKVSGIPNLPALIANYGDFDFYDGWQKYCKVLDTRSRALSTFEGAIYLAALSIPVQHERDVWTSSCLELLASLKRVAVDSGHEDRPTKRRRQSKVRQNAPTRAREQAPLATAFDNSLPSLGNTVGNDVVLNAPIPDPKPGFPQIVRMAALDQLENTLGSFLWSGLVSSQQRLKELTTPTANSLTATVALHLPPYEGYDFMLEITVSSTSGKSVSEAKLSSVGALRGILGEMLFRGAMRSDARKEEVSRGQDKHTEAVQVYEFGNEGDCRVTVMLDFETGRVVAARY